MATVEALLRRRCSSCGSLTAPIKVACRGCTRLSCGECALDDEIATGYCWMCLDWSLPRARGCRKYGQPRAVRR